VLKTLKDRTAAEMCEAIVDAVRQFTGLEQQADDVTLLIVKPSRA
jgi:serine phosphatase RsbU (regulator of sigma subunit)